jgi:alkanesulfonate monooxygenase SsuD/methylene tetrahydromethanopterin reductase-like flavin-dependent oxidoreductase (luciferase family)
VSSFPARRGRTGLQLGIHVGQQNTTMSDLLERVQRFDAVVDWVSVWDHLYEAPPNGGNTPHFEAVATLGALAAVTSTARLGCLMFCVPFRNPALLAKACVAIDHASGGRFEPGFGAGWHEPEFKAHGYEFPSLGTRFDMLTDGMEIITGMFGGDTTTYSGAHFSVDEVTCVPGPLNSSMPLWAGGRGPKRTPAIAAKYCSGWNVPYVGAEEFGRLNRQLDDACTAIGRDPATLERSVNLAFHMGANREAADGELQRIVDQWGPEMAERVTAGALTGTPDDALDQIAEFRDAGADLVNVALRLPVDDDALTAYLESVIPAAHAAFV